MRKPKQLFPPNTNPTLLSLLKMGCKITLPDGRWLNGEPSTGYLVAGFDPGGWVGRWCLDRTGLRNALCDRDFHPEDWP